MTARELRLPLLSAGLLALSFPPVPLVFPVFLALVPLAVHVARLAGGSPELDREGGRRALSAGGVTGTASWALLLAWVPAALARLPAGTLPAPRGVAVPLLYLALVAVLAAVTAAAAWTLHRLLRVAHVPLWLALPLAWSGGEWLRGHLPGGLAFPWLGLATALTPRPELLALAEVTGASGVGFWIALVAGLIAQLVAGAGPGERRGLLAALAAVLVIPAAGGLLRARAFARDAGPTVRVAVVQPGSIGPTGGGDPRTVDSLIATLDRGDAQLVLLPEGVLRGEPTAAHNAAAVERLSAQARRLGVPVLFGAAGVAAPGVPGEHLPLRDAPYLNAVFAATAGGLSSARVDKRQRVPFVETPALFSPRDEPAGVPVLAVTSDVGGGPLRVGILICFESGFPEDARRARRAGARMLLNPTNDGWIGGRAWYLRTPGLWQHPAHLVLRAVEHRTGVARAASTGISLFVDPTGRVHAETGVGVPAVAVGEVALATGPTPFTRVGDLVGPATALAALLLGLARRRPRAGGPAGSRAP